MSSSDHEQRPNVVSINSTGNQDKIARQVLWQRLQPDLYTLTTKHLQQVMQNLFDSTDDALFRLAENSPEGMDKSIYFDSMRIIRLQRKQIETRFFKELDSFFVTKKLPDDQVEHDALNIRFDELELVSESDLEINLAVDNLIQKIRNLYSADINASEKRYNWLLGIAQQDKQTVSPNTIPFSAEAIVKAFAKVTEEIDLTIEIQLILLKLFDMQCIHSLTSLFQDINELFIANNVLPVIKHEIIRQPTQSRGESSSGKIPPANTMTSSSSPMWGELQNLLKLQRNSVFSGVGIRDNSEFVSVDQDIQVHQGVTAQTSAVLTTQDVLASLNDLQSHAINEIPDGGAHAVGNYLRVQLQMDPIDGRTQKPINPVDNDLIDIVCLIFEYILEDPQLPSVARASIGRLQIPMLKVAMIDKNFFSMNGHPARSLLNKLASSAVGIDETEGLDNPYLNKIHEIVEYVMNYFTDDLGLFEKLLIELNQFLKQQEEDKAEMHEDLLQHQHEREELILAQSWVRETLSQHLLGRELPVAVVDIILGPWKDVMLQTYLNEGEDSQLWQTQIRFIDVLCWSVEPKLDKVDKSKLGIIIQQLVKTLRHGLESIDYDKLEITKIFSRLEPYHMASMRGRDLSETVQPPTVSLEEKLKAARDERKPEQGVVVEPEKVILEDIVLQGWEQDDEVQQINDEYLELARHLEMGKWVEFMDESGNVRRAKLAWKSDLLGEYTFLNWKFDVVADKSLFELASELRAGQARVVDEVPLMDRALSAVVSNLIPKSN